MTGAVLAGEVTFVVAAGAALAGSATEAFGAGESLFPGLGDLAFSAAAFGADLVDFATVADFTAGAGALAAAVAVAFLRGAVFLGV